MIGTSFIYEQVSYRPIGGTPFLSYFLKTEENNYLPNSGANIVAFTVAIAQNKVSRGNATSRVSFTVVWSAPLYRCLPSSFVFDRFPSFYYIFPFSIR